MDPLEIHDAPGKSDMGMDLVPVYEDELVGGVDVHVDPVTRQNMGIRTAVVKKGPLNYTIRAYGHITYDETRTAQVSPKVDGWIETLHVNFTGEGVQAGDPLFEIYSPQLLSAQEEYLALYRSLKVTRSPQTASLLDSSRRRLSYFDVAETEIRAMEASGVVNKTVRIRSPFSGVVILNLAVVVGFIALAGLAAETGVVMLVYLDDVFHRQGTAGKMKSVADLREAIIEGAAERVRPKIMTVATTLIGLLPVMWGNATGSQVMKRIAAPMVGGLISSTVLTLVIIPVVYFIWKEWELKHEK